MGLSLFSLSVYAKSFAHCICILIFSTFILLTVNVFLLDFLHFLMSSLSLTFLYIVLVNNNNAIWSDYYPILSFLSCFICYLKDFLKYSTKAGLDCKEIEKAVELMSLVPKQCNDMMNLGRLQGYEGKLTAQGKLLQQDTFFVTEQDSGVLSRSKERRVFLFEQIAIFSELLRKGSSTPGYQFKKSIKVSYLSMEEHVESDPCKFVLSCRGSSERLTLQAANIDIKKEWVQSIRELLDMQINFLTGKQSGGSLSRQLSNSSRSSSSHPSTPLKPNTTPNGSPAHNPNKHVEEELDEGECNGLSSVLVTQDYNAVKEDEICVVVGEKVQILASNQQNMCLVYRPANSQSPAAEGWVPGHVLSSTR
uniref:Kalirin RhoGEF kinase b n=1 Tax=Sinocyclocheilus grahami TaxID=75366 RepID=A0A672SZZ1_SINGR